MRRVRSCCRGTALGLSPLGADSGPAGNTLLRVVAADGAIMGPHLALIAPIICSTAKRLNPVLSKN